MQIDDLDLASIGPVFESHEVFPAKTNTEFVEVGFSSPAPAACRAAFPLCCFLLLQTRGHCPPIASHVPLPVLVVEQMLGMLAAPSE